MENPEKRRGKGRPKGFDRESALCAALQLFWEKGYEPASVAELCQVMHINPPSLYCCFGNKAALFLEAARYYEKRYWQNPAEKFMREPDLFRAVADFFREAAEILLSPETPCGCMIVLAAINISPLEKEIISEIRKMRMETMRMFARGLEQAVSAGQISADTDVDEVAASLTAYLEGLSIQARDGIPLSRLLDMAAKAIFLLPSPGTAL